MTPFDSVPTQRLGQFRIGSLTTPGWPATPPVAQLAKLGSLACAGGPALRFVSRGIANDIDRKRPLSRHWLCVGEVAAKPADDHAGGAGVGSAGLAGLVRESVAGGGLVQLGDVLLGDDGGEM